MSAGNLFHWGGHLGCTSAFHEEGDQLARCDQPAAFSHHRCLVLQAHPFQLLVLVCSFFIRFFLAKLILRFNTYYIPSDVVSYYTVYTVATI